MAMVQSRLITAFGQTAVTPDGRKWVYVKASEAVAKGNVVIPAAVTSIAATNFATTTDALGRNVYLTKTGASFTPGQFENGWIAIDGGTGSGQVAKIKTNTATMIELYPDFALTTATAADTTAKVWTQNYVRKAVVTSKIQNPTGVAQVAFAANDYGWVLKNGLGLVIAGEVLIVGSNFVTGDDTAGQVIKGTTAKGPFDETNLGVVVTANSAADLGALVYVTL
jgi:hypothetical protein